MGLVETAMKSEVNALPGSEWTPSKAACMEKYNHLSPALLPDTAAKRLALHKEDNNNNNRFTALWNLSGKTRVSRYQKNIHPLLSS